MSTREFLTLAAQRGLRVILRDGEPVFVRDPSLPIAVPL